jgi:shikimate kinase
MPMLLVYLIGFMGAGKSSVGRRLAALLGWDFVDLDTEIELREGLQIRQIFEQFGEPRFREIERETLRRVAGRVRAVVSLGGGAYVDPENQSVADATGVTVWLKVSFENALGRVTIDGARPLFQDRERAERLYRDRLASYERARLHVSTDGELPDTIARQISALVKPYLS